MKKLMFLAVLALGTTAMVNAQNVTDQKAPAKEAKMEKGKKHMKKEAKKEAKTEATKATK